jgi:hypothetical protein
LNRQLDQRREKTASTGGGRSTKFNTVNTGHLTIAVDDNRLAITVDVPVAITLLDHDGVVTIAMVTLPDDFTIAIAITIAMAGSHGHADRADTYANFARAGRHGDANCGRRDSHYCKTLDHCMLLNL